MSTPNFKVLQKLEDRLKDIAETVGSCSATLFGTEFEGALLVVGLSINNESGFSTEHHNPLGLNVVGVADIKKSLSEDQLLSKLHSINAAKNPVALNVSAAGTLKAGSLVDGKLLSSDFDILEDDDFFSAFMYVNFVVAAAIETDATEEIGAETAEEATEMSSEPTYIRKKLKSDPPVFKIPGTESVVCPSNVVPNDLFSENQNNTDTKDPRLPENLVLLTIEAEFSYDTKFLRKLNGRDEKLSNINTVCLVLKDNSLNLLELFVESLLKSLKLFEAELSGGNGEMQNFSSFIFCPREVGYVVSAIFPLNTLEDVLFKKRLLLHEALALATSSPKFTFSLALSHFFGEPLASGYTGETHLVNVHDSLKPPKLKEAQIVTVRGFYNYYHYLQDGETDDGWGCAYRSLQTIFSWFLWQGYVTSKVPSIREIQETLVKIKDKPDSFVGSKQWIGSQELCYVLDETANVMCRIIHVSTGKGMLDERFTISSHFEEQGTPIMVGGGQYAYTILGIACGDSPSETRFLILDPHYVGPHDIKSILKKNGVVWKAVDLFKNGQFYNMCLPLASSTF